MAFSQSLPAFCSAVGFVTIVVLLCKILKLVIIYTRPTGLKRYAHSSPSGKEPWALVTGATDGIGNALAHELAASGFNIVLHGRNREKLSRVQSEIQAIFPRRSFRTLVVDASTAASAADLKANPQDSSNVLGTVDFDDIKRQLHDIHLTVLVNNAGGGSRDPSFLPVHKSSEVRITENVSLNAIFPLHLTRALLPTLARHQPSLVMNLSSMADQGFPLIVSYSASKAFLMAATRALRLEMEMEDLKVEILGIRVGRVTGSTVCREPPSLFLPSASTMAKAALARAGYGNGVVVGYWAHALQQLSASLFTVLPRWVEDKVMTTIMLQMSKEKTS